MIGTSVLLIVALALPLAGKGPTLKITMTGGSLQNPIETTDPSIERFRVWEGAGTLSGLGPNTIEGTQGFVIEWDQGVVASPPAHLEIYDVSFHVIHQNRPMAYVVTYAYDPSTGVGYIYLPGRGEQNFEMNAYLIYRRVEGNWFHATRNWNSFARSLLERRQ